MIDHTNGCGDRTGSRVDRPTDSVAGAMTDHRDRIGVADQSGEVDEDVIDAGGQGGGGVGAGAHPQTPVGTSRSDWMSAQE